LNQKETLIIYMGENEVRILNCTKEGFNPGLVVFFLLFFRFGTKN
jgi:hypothetical protein